MNTNLVKGFNDYTGEKAFKRAKVKQIIEDTFKLYGFEPAETPIIENRSFVQGDNINDEAVSDIYKLEDKGKRKLALRYEFTFQLKRLMKNKKLPYKRYQIGSVFRNEPISTSRFRQFTQCDIDIINTKTKDEAEILSTISDILNKLNIKFTIYINNRRLLNEILDDLGIKNKSAVIKEIDKLDKLSEKEVKQNLKKYNAEKALLIFKKPKKYFEKYKAFQEIKELEKFCKLYKIKTEFLATLARGLSYYNGTIFEVKTKEMKETIFGGGAYLFNNIQCCGYAAGLDRLSTLAKIDLDKNQILIISLNQDKAAIELAQKIRNQNIPCQTFYKKPSKALEYANSYNIPYVIFLGDKEVKSKKIKIKDMKTGKEQALSNTQLTKFLEKLKN
ncbi:histidine--tRNA ligase [Candidatus Pacearchaeota archaeon]|nr:histidine--tRNA ligase [Candidatus Pacearchaeota archaeon]